MITVDPAEVLAAIESGLVAQYPHDVYGLPDCAYDSPEVALEYRQTVLLMVDREWAMPSGKRGRHGGDVLRLTSIGERRLIDARAMGGAL